MSEEIASVNQDNFKKVVLESEKPVLVDFWAPWCGPCKAVSPVVEELAQEYSSKAGFAKVNVDEAPLVASTYGIMSIPTLIVFKNGEPAEQVIGYKPKSELKKLLDSTV
jgi:thioredoxin 1